MMETKTLNSHLNKKRRNEYGLSMIELLVVIVIIGILAATAIGVTLNQRVKANDATLKSDLRNVAAQIAAWNVDNTNFQQVGLGNNRVQLNIPGEKIESENPWLWNEQPELPHISVSDYTLVEVVIINSNHPSWERVFEPGEFCLTATNPNSTYDYVPGSGGGQKYRQYLFYDVKAGGVKTMDELVETYQNDQEISCYGYVKRYLDAIETQA